VLKILKLKPSEIKTIKTKTIRPVSVILRADSTPSLSFIFSLFLSGESKNFSASPERQYLEKRQYLTNI